jgi:hypothetical protein
MPGGGRGAGRQDPESGTGRECKVPGQGRDLGGRFPEKAGSGESQESGHDSGDAGRQPDYPTKRLRAQHPCGGGKAAPRARSSGQGCRLCRKTSGRVPGLLSGRTRDRPDTARPAWKLRFTAPPSRIAPEGASGSRHFQPLSSRRDRRRPLKTTEGTTDISAKDSVASPLRVPRRGLQPLLRNSRGSSVPARSASQRLTPALLYRAPPRARPLPLSRPSDQRPASPLSSAVARPVLRPVAIPVL